MTDAQAQHQKDTTTQLLASSESTLANIRRSLNSGEQEMVTQARNYIAQSRKAIDDGDLERAHNLAIKAHLLADELAK